MNRRLRAISNRFRHMHSVPRKVIGILLILGGLLGFLPIVGFWMIPLGLLVLSWDFKWARRGYLSIHSWIRKWRYRKR